MLKIRFSNIYLLTLAIVFLALGAYSEWHFIDQNLLMERSDDYLLLYPGLIHLTLFLFGFLTIISVYLLEKRESKILLLNNKLLNKEIDERKRVEKDREKLINELQAALAKVKILSGLLPICSSCKDIRDDKGYWSQIEVYIRDHSEADFSHSICPRCAKDLYPDLKLDSAIMN